ncbi:DUF4129 domain-containing protein [Mycolicibacterium aichiense]|uniref:Protein-glutamine gamma-glutamyltransferase-like C-terminal domain-containing protein n=1 Tax=Mycolicibacterium aichiense TaxID=1799 RepID=A0AAD1HQL4_9MYCO|nr:DUF4129 domain-containing protein [Mycolicibacterium aichiense]MCV7020180.1 DUF4129 domain-containing protein [Mycolicibacterium aichiense]BBX07776.1 hypothetical protein MAIC_25790 [Mycolicibacterium aichiense]STZ81588.1 Uncharacterised protein [Mycolicibacterium aichiense]
MATAATPRVAALIALVVVLGLALRGHLPDAPRSPRTQPAGGAGSLLALLTLVLACLLVIIVALVAKLRDPQRAKQAARTHVPGGGGGMGVRRSWRFVLVIVAAVVAWLMVAALLAQLRLPQPGGDPPHAQPVATPTGNAPPGEAVSPPQAPPEPAAVDPLFWYLLAAFAALLLVTLIGAIVLRARDRRREPVPPPPDDTSRDAAPPGPGSLALAAERGLAEVGDLSREPREAIIACYAAMEHALANAPGAAPQESDTPSEVLARAVEHHAIHAGRATELVTLFAEARFSTHVMNEGHRDSAERALRLVLGELRSSV